MSAISRWTQAVAQNVVANILVWGGSFALGGLALVLAWMTPAMDQFAPLSYLFAVLGALLLGVLTLSAVVTLYRRFFGQAPPVGADELPAIPPPDEAAAPPRLTNAERERVSSALGICESFLRERFPESLDSFVAMRQWRKTLIKEGPSELHLVVARITTELSHLAEEFDALTRTHATELQLAGLDLRPLRSRLSNAIHPLAQTDQYLARLPSDLRDPELIGAQMQKAEEAVGQFRSVGGEANNVRAKRVDMAEGRL